jgi:hypothetical protein
VCRQNSLIDNATPKDSKMLSMDRQTFQTIVTKLDTGAITLKEAKEFVRRLGAKPEGRTKEQFIRSLYRQLA